MSDTLSQDPDGLGAPFVSYTLAPSYPQTPATPSSTVQDAPPGANLPPFSTFAADMDSGGAFSSVSDRLFSDTRLLDISNWDYYTETRVLDRGENGLSIITSQPQYRPWESKPVDASTSTYAGTAPINTLAEAFAQQNGAPKLPSFQSQFQSFSEAVTTTEPTLTTLTNLTPVSPNSSSPQSHSLTTLNSNFHTLSAVNVNPRSYPLVPAPIQAREIPSIQQQFLDERHIQLYSHPPGNITLNNAIHPTFLNSQNGAIIKNNQLISSPTVVTVLKSEPDIKLGANLAALHQESIKLQNVGLHPTQFQNPMTQIPNTDGVLFNGVDKKLNSNMTSPTRNDFRKKERRKIRASSLESSIDSDGASSNMDIGSENSGQVAAISSTAGYKTHQMHVNSSVDMDTDISGGSVDKQVKKKRKRCGECVGCQRKDNCGDCAPCRNDKSHQICKQRRCEKLTEKKNLYQDGFLRGESRRGRGKGRGGASYRGRKPTGSAAPLGGGSTLVSPETNGSSVVASSVQPSSRPSSQPAQVQQTMPVQQQPMTPMPFYADPNRFPTPVWQADPSQGWTQGQFIQQIPATGQPIEAYQQYPNGIYQTTYQQPAFETNTFYTGAVQVLTNPRPPSAPNQQVQLAPARPNSNYSHTPSPSPVQQQQQNATGRQYQEYIGQQTGGQQQNQQGFIQSGSSQTGNDTQGNNSRPSSVNTIMNPPTPNQNFSPQQQQQQQGQQQNNQQSNNTYTSISNFSPSPTVNYVNANSGNAQPGYPQVNSSSPQLTSHISSGYPGQEQYSGQDQWQNDGQIMWEHQVKMEPNYDQEQYMQEVDNSPAKMENLHHNLQSDKPFSQADKVNLNTRIKTMILNKQQENNKMEESKAVEQNSTGHFLSYSHHQHLKKHLGDDGGFQNRYDSKNILDLSQRHIPANPQKFAQTKHVQNIQNPTFHHNFEQNYYPNPLNRNVTVKQEYCETLEFDHYNNIRIRQPESFSNRHDMSQTDWRTNEYVQSGQHRDNKTPSPMKTKRTSTPLKGKPSPDKCSKQQLGVGMEIPDCKCIPSDQFQAEPGVYYTHLGCADNLKSLRHDLESRTGVTGASIRIEKLRYTGKEGKTSQGCPIAKWVIRRQNEAEKYLVLVKQRTGHRCHSTFIVIGLVAWEGVPQENADDLYAVLTDKLNRFGLPTKRRCATNDPRTCACQGVDENTCGASFTFGCSWSMYYNGCKFTRSKEARKFRLTEKNEEETIERKLQDLSDQISPVYRILAPQSFQNQTVHESTASDCRLGRSPGRPFCGVTACVDFCAHSHKDMHNMIDGCTVVVTLTKYKGISKPPDEQLHVLPMYVPEDTDEYGSRENQNQKVLDGGIEVLEKYPCEVRTSSSPAEKCVVRRSKKNKDQEPKKPRKKKSTTPEQPSTSQSPSTSMDDIIRNDEVQNNQVSSTVLGYPNKSSRMRYDSFCNSSNSSFSSMYLNRNENVYGSGSYPSTPSPSLPEFSIFKTPPPPYYSPHDTYSNPYFTPPSAFSYSSCYSPQFGSPSPYSVSNPSPYSIGNPSPNSISNPSPYGISNPFDDLYSTSILPLPTSCDETSKKTVDISYTDNLECFEDGEIGGVAISLPHGSVLFECAKHEVHATTALKTPNRLAPTRISLVFYQHKSMNKPQHGWLEYSEKMKLKLDPDGDSDKLEFDTDARSNAIKTNSDIVVRNTTLPSYTFSTVFPMYPCMVTGPYQEIEKS